MVNKEILRNPPKTLSEAILENRNPINQAFGELKPTSPDVFTEGNEHIQQEAFADLLGELAGFDDSEKSRDVATNSVAFADLVARLYGREVDGIGAYDDFFQDGEPVTPEKVDEILQPYMQDNEAVNWLVDEYVKKVDPENVNEDATKRLLKVAMYLTEETEEMQAEAEEQADIDEQFWDIANAETQQAEVNQRFDGIVAKSLPEMQSQEHFDRQFNKQVQEEYSAEFAEIVDGVELSPHLDDRTEKQYAEAFDGMVKNIENDKLTHMEIATELARNGMKIHREALVKGIERRREVARAAFSFWTGGFLSKADTENKN